MDKSLVGSLTFVFIFLNALGLQEGPPPAQSAESQVQELPAQTAPVPRIPGKAQTQAEWEAWHLVELAQNPEERALLAQQFLQDFPESGLTSHAHYLLAQDFYAKGDIDNFIHNAELALEEIPNLVDLLSQLAFFYAEKGDSQKAIARASRALHIVDQMQVPSGASTGEFVVQTYQLRAEANYALGRAHLGLFSQSKGGPEDSNLTDAIEYLQAALRFDPKHDYASFRLGFAERNANNAENALQAYGRTVAIGQIAANPARAQIEEVLGILRQAMPDSPLAQKSVETVIEEGAQELHDAISRNQQEKSMLIQQLDQQSQPLNEERPSLVAPPSPPDSRDE